MKYLYTLSKDPKLKKLLQSIPAEKIQITETRTDLREFLVGSIISQQLSTKVARVIQQRFMELYKNKFPSNKAIIKTDDERLRSIGLSYQKLSYIKNIALFFEENKLHKMEWHSMDEVAISKLLTQIKGVGQWTAEMVLMFGLGREDVFSVGDYGIQMAMKKLYNLNLEGKDLQKRMILISEKWKPYRTAACLYLWAWKDK